MIGDYYPTDKPRRNMLKIHNLIVNDILYVDYV